jgi:hypothetical protein
MPAMRPLNDNRMVRVAYGEVKMVAGLKADPVQVWQAGRMPCRRGLLWS